MTKYKTITLPFLLMLAISALSACGQKGPLEVERPPAVQEDVLDESI